MKTLFPLLAVSALALSAPAQANDTAVKTAFSAASGKSLEMLRHCFDADVQVSSSRAIRACTKSYRDSAPNSELRSEIMMRRGLLNLSAGRADDAARDFRMASRINGENAFASLGMGFAALVSNDVKTARTMFQDCNGHARVKPLATYGTAMLEEMSGNPELAMRHYEAASQLRPDWNAPRLEMARIKSTG